MRSTLFGEVPDPAGHSRWTVRVALGDLFQGPDDYLFDLGVGRGPRHYRTLGVGQPVEPVLAGAAPAAW